MSYMYRAAWIRSFLLSAVCAASAACAVVSPSGDQHRTIFKNVNVIPMHVDGLVPSQNVVIQGGRILSMRPARTIRWRTSDEVIDGTGKYLMPGLWDMHVHASGHRDSDPVRTNLPLFVAYGIVGVRDMGSTLADLTTMRAAQRANPILPHLIAAGPLLDGPKRPWQPAIARPLNDVADVGKAVTELKAAHVDFLKVYDGLSPEQYRALVAAASDAGLRIAGHIPLRVTLSEVAAAGQRSVEHVSLRLIAGCTPNGDQAMSEVLQAWIKEGAEGKYRKIHEWFRRRDVEKCRADYVRAADLGVFVTPTLSFEFFGGEWTSQEDLSALSPQGRKECEFNMSMVERATATTRAAALEDLRQLVRDLHQSGIRLLAGTDVPNSCLSPGRSLHKELQLLHAAGLSQQETLATATVDVGRFLGRADVGVIRAHAAADLLLLDASPLESIANSQRIAGVMRNGHWLDSDELDRIRSDALSVLARPVVGKQ